MGEPEPYTQTSAINSLLPQKCPEKIFVREKCQSAFGVCGKERRKYGHQTKMTFIFYVNPSVSYQKIFQKKEISEKATLANNTNDSFVLR
jgi:hypothetical protein